MKPVQDFVVSRMRVRPREVDVEEKVAHLIELEKLLKEDKAVKSVQVRYEDGGGKKLLLTSEGTRIEWDYNYLYQGRTLQERPTESWRWPGTASGGPLTTAGSS